MAKLGEETRRRNAAIVRRHKAGETVASLANHYGVSIERIRQIIKLARLRAEQTEGLHARFGEKPDVQNLPDDTPVEVLMVMPSKLHGWRTRIHNLRYSELEITTLGHLRRASDRQLQGIPNVGRAFIRELRRYCPGTISTD